MIFQDSGGSSRNGPIKFGEKKSSETPKKPWMVLVIHLYVDGSKITGQTYNVL